MKKIKRLVIGGIESKILALVLVSMLLVAAVFLTAMLMQNSYLTTLTQQTGERQLATLTGTAEEVMDSMIVENIDAITDLQAKMIDNMFREQEISVQLVADYAGKLLSDPDSAPRMPWQRPDASHDGELFVKVLFAEGADEAALADQLGVIANMSDLMVSLCSASGTDNIWFSLPEGATLMVDTVPGNWINADGSYVAYNASDRYWYRQAVEAGKLVFSDVEYDYRTGNMCVTCAQPVYGADGSLLGVAGADLFVDEMQQTIQKSSAMGGLLGVINQSGHLIIAPKENGFFQVENSEDAEDLRLSEFEELGALVRDAMQKKTDVHLVHVLDETYYAIGIPLETVDWALLAAFSQSLVDQPVDRLEADYQAIEAEAATAYRGRSFLGRIISWCILVLLLFVMLELAFRNGKRIVRPLNTITQQIAELSDSNDEFQMKDEYRTGDEVEALADSFAKLYHEKLVYLETVQRVTAEKERIGAELSLATEIQASMMPHIIPAFPDRKDFDIVGNMNPAKEVGGDFYDYFLVDDDHLCMVIADVSGKGVPAALFMMSCRIILRSAAMLGCAPAEILAMANQAICSDNEAEMFVTVWVGILELSTGRLTCSNAGHEYPVLKQPGGNYELYKDRHGFVIGGLDQAKYHEYELQLQPGAKLFVYTDGVPEATNADKELFGTARMVDTLNTAPDAAPIDVLQNMRHAVDRFVLDAEQFDDLTMLCLEYKGPQAAEQA